MNSVYIVISILNGYKNVEAVFKNEADAIAYKAGMEYDTFHYGKHEVYVCKYNVR